MSAAEQLLQRGSRRPFEILKERYDTPGLHPADVFNRDEIVFLTRFGGPEEWKMIQVLIELEVATEGQIQEPNVDPDSGGVVEALLGEPDLLSLWSVPSLAAMLGQTNVYDEDRFFASEAVKALQMITGQPFGFQDEGSIEERAAAAEKAARWWRRTGQTEYSSERLSNVWATVTPSRSIGRSDQQVPSGLYSFRWGFKKQTAPSEDADSSTSTTIVEMKVAVRQQTVRCVESSNPDFLNSTGTLEAEGKGSFLFRLSIPGYEEVRAHWKLRIDGRFELSDGEKKAAIEPLGAANTASSKE